MIAAKIDKRWAGIVGKITNGAPRALLLDYDGTLAPFQVERDQAYMDPRYRVAIEAICRAGRTRLVIISGRAIDDLTPLLNMTPMPEIWGSHGWERLLASGEYIGPDLPRSSVAAIQQAAEWARSGALEGRLETKPSGIAVHWRGMATSQSQLLADRFRSAWTRLICELELEIHEFDGGLELRASGRDKGFAVAQILRETPPDAAVAYAGDDYTDEDAFRAMSGRGLSILVRASRRDTAADLWLRPPDEWARFLNDWMQADAGG